MTNPPNKKKKSSTNIPNVLATTIVFKIAPSNLNIAPAIWCIQKYASSWLKNLKPAER
jgi:hypothetical protein